MSNWCRSKLLSYLGSWHFLSFLDTEMVEIRQHRRQWHLLPNMINAIAANDLTTIRNQGKTNHQKQKFLSRIPTHPNLSHMVATVHCRRRHHGIPWGHTATGDGGHAVSILNDHHGSLKCLLISPRCKRVSTLHNFKIDVNIGSCYLNQCWLIINEILWHSSESLLNRKCSRYLSLIWVWILVTI